MLQIDSDPGHPQIQSFEWQADHVGPRSFDLLDEIRASALDAVRAGLVERFAGRDVGFDRGFVVPPEGDPRRLDLAGVTAVVGAHEENRRHHLVGARSQCSQHGTSFLGIPRFAQHPTADHDAGVGGEDDAGRLVRIQPGRHASRLGFGESQDQRPRRLVGQGVLGEVRRTSDRDQAEAAEQIQAAGRGRGKHQSIGLRHVSSSVRGAR